MSDDAPDVSADPLDRTAHREAPADPRAADLAADAHNDTDGGDDCFGPPKEPCECYCLHCRRTFMSSGIWFQRIRNARGDHLDGFWMCPTPNCDGKGFTFDIFPTDPDHPANDGWFSTDEDDDEFDDEEWDEEFDNEDAAYGDAEYDPDEPQYKRLDEFYGEDDDDLEGEEWKLGLQPGERPEEPEWVQNSRREWEEEQKRYDAPDERPREIEWEEPEYPSAPGGDFREDDIPF
ncbi:MAG: hypothetical protein ABIP55_14115 [Tepidisphaeraceae bacterium]